jgi:hypothetical protein
MWRSDVWLNIPQAVVLEATRDLQRAQGVEDNDPCLLVMKATLLVAPRVFLPVAADATDGEVRLARAQVWETVAPRTGPGGSYESILSRVRTRLVDGVTAKGSRARNLPLEIVDPAEFARLELYGIDVIDPRTRGVVWYDLLLSGRELIKACTVEPVKGKTFSDARPWDCAGDPHPELVQWARSKWGDTTRMLPGRDQLLQMHRQQFGRVPGISERAMRDLRRALASEKARRGGAPTHLR